MRPWLLPNTLIVGRASGQSDEHDAVRRGGTIGELVRRLHAALEKAATPPPWTLSGREIDGPDRQTVLAVEDLPAHAYPELQSGELVAFSEDLELMVAAVNALPALLAALGADAEDGTLKLADETAAELLRLESSGEQFEPAELKQGLIALAAAYQSLRGRR